MSVAQGHLPLLIQLGAERVDPESLGLFAADLCFSRHDLASFTLSFARGHNSKVQAQTLDWTQLLRLQLGKEEGEGNSRSGKQAPEGMLPEIPARLASVPSPIALLEGWAWTLQSELDTHGGGAFVVQGFDRGAPMRAWPKTRSWAGLGIEELARQLAREHGLGFEWRKQSGKIRGQKTVWEEKGRSAGEGLAKGSNFQAHESDWSFLRRLALEASVELQVVGDVLQMGGANPAPMLELQASPASDGLAPISLQAAGDKLDLVFNRPTLLWPSRLLRVGAWGAGCEGEYRVASLRLVHDGGGWSSFVQASRV